MRLSGNKILITGASEGIGKALTLKFIELNNNVIALGRNSEKLHLLAQQDNRIIPYPCDLASLESLIKLEQFIKTHHPDINILINNAGIQYNYHFEKEANLIERIDYEIAVNLSAPIRLTALLHPYLEKNPNAAIVNVSSALGLVPKMSAPVYCGTKAGIHIFTKSLRYQLNNVKVFEIIPPLVDTQMTQGRGKGKISPEQLVDEFIKNFKRDNFEITIGKVKLLRWINRLFPALAENIMKRN